uniref:DDE Tnp4 domain-containing protein n=1 Tax=Cacopsylla melanoneura TaxID=428564 RepID=A0A8D8W757_9HEMI
MELVKFNLPVPFRFRYKNVYCIIDCLETEIQKPSDPVYQSATWSEYKKCNTVKYLVACTPQGFINFVSSGYGGRISDAKIIEKSGFLNNLKPGMQIMADRGFKSVDSLFLKKGCTLVRPPSVYANIKPTKDQVKETKRIASLRVIIENVIGRIRHFKLLSPHACVPVKNLDQLDFAIQSACGLINLQYPVRK